MRALFLLFITFSFTANVTFSELWFNHIGDNEEFITNVVTKGKIISKGRVANSNGTANDVLYILYKKKLYACSLNGISWDRGVADIACADMFVKK